MAIPNTKPTFIVLALEQPSDRDEVAEILMDEGYRVIASTTAEQAIAVIHARWETRLVVASGDLPGPMDGYALARLLDVKWPGIGIVVIGTHDPRAQDLPSKAAFLLDGDAQSSLIPAVHELLGEPRTHWPGRHASAHPSDAN